MSESTYSSTPWSTITGESGYWYEWDPGYILDYEEYPSVIAPITGVNSTSGEKNPRWKAQVKSGSQAGTTFVGQKWESRIRPYASSVVRQTKEGYPWKDNYWRQKGTWGYVTQGFSDIDDPVSLVETKANNEALKQLVNKIRKKQTTFQGGTSIGELARTIALIKNPAKALRLGIGRTINRVNKLGRLNRRLSKKEKRRILTDTWLELQLGWLPLISEVDDGLKVFAESQVFDDYSSRSSVRAIGTEEAAIHSDLGHSASHTTPNTFYRTIDYSKVSVRYIALVDVGSYAVYDARRMGVDRSNWLPTAWELIPYSFLIDYFTNIGGIISAASLAKSSVRWVLKTVRKEISVTHFSVGRNDPEDSAVFRHTASQWTPMYSSCTRRVVNRSPYYGSLVPSLEFSLPGSSTQWLNVAALFAARKRTEKYYR